MKKTLLIAFALLAALSATGCNTKLSEINKAAFAPMTLDTGSGRQAYDGGTLPAGDEILKTYRFETSFTVPQNAFESWPTLIIGPSAFSYRLYLNGRLLALYGEKGDRNRTRMYSTQLVNLPEGTLQETNTLLVEAEVSTERPPLMELGIADSFEGSSYVYWRNFFMTQFVAGGTVVGILLLVYFMFMYLLSRGANPRFLWFALFCGFFSLSCINVVFNHLSASDTWLTKIGRMGFFFSVIMFSFYVMEATGILAKKRWLKTAELIAGIAATVFVMVQKDFNATAAAFNLAIQVVITPNLLFCVVLIVAAVIKGGFKQYAILCLGFAGVIATSIRDMGFETKNIMPYAWTLVYGYEWLVICVFLELAIKQERVSQTAIKQADALNRKNEILQSVFQHLRSGSDTLTNSTVDLTVSTREISVTGTQQAAAVREIVATMEDASGLLNHISIKSASVHQDSQATAQKADEGVAHVKNTLEKLEAVIGRISESISMISDFNDQLGSITEIVKLIEGIATQIRIIAFNASLEAVAAGDAGRNFRIVAEEVKRLSDSTMSSVKIIRERVTALIAKSNNVVQVSRQGYQSLEQSWDIASDLGSSFAGIAESAESSAQATADIDASIREESQAFNQILQALKEISAGVNNFVDSATHTSETTDTLNGIAERLHGLIVQYSDKSTDGEAEK